MTAGKAARIARLSKALSVLCLAPMVLIPMVVIAFWVFGGRGDIAAWQTLGETPFVLNPLKRLGGAALTLIPTAIGLYGLMQLRRLLAAFAAGRYFDAAAIAALKRFSAAMLYSVLAKIITHPMLTVLLTYDNPPGQGVLAVNISSDHLYMLLLSGVFLVIAWIMAEGGRIARENAEIV